MVLPQFIQKLVGSMLPLLIPNVGLCIKPILVITLWKALMLGHYALKHTNSTLGLKGVMPW
jgi:hypothetical protein